MKCDAFVFLDGVSYQKNGVQNRNALKTQNGETWLTVPVSGPLGTPIKDVLVANQLWQRKHWRTIEQNYKKAHYFRLFSEELKSVYDNEWIYLSELNIHLSIMLMRWLGIDRPIFFQSKLGVVGTSTDLLVDICSKVGASCYLSGPGGAYMDVVKFQMAGVAVELLPSNSLYTYPQQNKKISFLEDLSVLDVLMNCGDGWVDYIPCVESCPWKPK